MDSTKYSLEEVGNHKTSSSTWLVIHDKVYDVTKFLQDHPGGEEVLLDNAGKEATNEFEDVGHSTEAVALLETYYIGDLRDEDKKPKAKQTTAKPATTHSTSTNNSSFNVAIFIPLVVIAVAVGVYLFMRN